MRATVLIALVSLFALPLAPQTETEKPCPTFITVSAHASARAKPDLAIVFMAVRSSAGIAADALAANQKKEQEIETRLGAMGLKGKFRFSGNRFGPAGPPNYGQPRSGVTGFDVSEYVYVFLDPMDFKSAAQLEKKVGEGIDELTRAGASAVDTMVPRLACQQSTCTVAFAVKDPSKYVQQATEEATKKARATGEGMARALGVQITGLRSANAGATQYYPQQSGPNPLEDLPYEFLSTSAEGVPVTISVTLEFITR